MLVVTRAQEAGHSGGGHPRKYLLREQAVGQLQKRCIYTDVSGIW